MVCYTVERAKTISMFNCVLLKDLFFKGEVEGVYFGGLQKNGLRFANAYRVGA